MDELKRMLVIEYFRLYDIRIVLLEQQASLPVGYIQKKNIRGREYFYLQHRDGIKVRTDYIKKSELEKKEMLLEKRREISADIGGIEEKMRAIEVLVGKDLPMLLKIRLAVIKVIKQYPAIKKITLFGSRAESRYREDSDVDLMFESNGPVSLMTQTEIRQKLEEELCLSVDLVHGPLNEDSLIEVNGEVEVYAA